MLFVVSYGQSPDMAARLIYKCHQWSIPLEPSLLCSSVWPVGLGWFQSTRWRHSGANNIDIWCIVVCKLNGICVSPKLNKRELHSRRTLCILHQLEAFCIPSLNAGRPIFARRLKQQWSYMEQKNPSLFMTGSKFSTHRWRTVAAVKRDIHLSAAEANIFLNSFIAAAVS